MRRIFLLSALSLSFLASCSTPGGTAQDPFRVALSNMMVQQIGAFQSQPHTAVKGVTP